MATTCTFLTSLPHRNLANGITSNYFQINQAHYSALYASRIVYIMTNSSMWTLCANKSISGRQSKLKNFVCMSVSQRDFKRKSPDTCLKLWQMICVFTVETIWIYYFFSNEFAFDWIFHFDAYFEFIKTICRFASRFLFTQFTSIYK